MSKKITLIINCIFLSSLLSKCENKKNEETYEKIKVLTPTMMAG